MATFGINNFLGNGHVSDAVKGFTTKYSNNARSPLQAFQNTNKALNFIKNFQNAKGIDRIAMIAELILGSK